MYIMETDSYMIVEVRKEDLRVELLSKSQISVVGIAFVDASVSVLPWSSTAPAYFTRVKRKVFWMLLDEATCFRTVYVGKTRCFCPFRDDRR